MGAPYPGRRREMALAAVACVCSALVTILAVHLVIEFANLPPDSSGRDTAAVDPVMVEDGSGRLTVEYVPRFGTEPPYDPQMELGLKVVLCVVFVPVAVAQALDAARI